jgi:ribose 1,5-bisphosphokinase PhnN
MSIQQVRYLLMPAASATGRDFLLEQLLKHPEVVAQMMGRESVSIGVMMKTTDRTSREKELTKRCVTSDEFSQGLANGEIVASYVLESNGKRYGYHKGDFVPQGGFDVLVADASVYQIPELKSHLGDVMHISGMVATRLYREENLRARGSENESQIQARLNLGDAHTAILLIMDGKIEEVDKYVHPDLAKAVQAMFDNTDDKNATFAELLVKYFTGSENVVSILKDLAVKKKAELNKLVDELVALGQDHRITPEMDVTQTLFFKTGVEMLQKALSKNS